MMVRFTFTYDDEFHKYIHDLIQNTPVKHRSELLRQLIRYGIMYQAQIQSAIASTKTPIQATNADNDVAPPSTDQPTSANDEAPERVNTEAKERKNKAVRFNIE